MVGGATLKSSVAQFILSRLKSKLYSKPADPILSTRELDVISLLAEGFVKKKKSPDNLTLVTQPSTPTSVEFTKNLASATPRQRSIRLIASVFLPKKNNSDFANARSDLPQLLRLSSC